MVRNYSENIIESVRNLLAFIAILTFCFTILILSPAPCRADIYKWRDTQGKLHFSDKPPADQKEAQAMSKVASDFMPSLEEGKRENSLVYQNNNFKLVLIKETPASLAFKLTYNNIDQAYPQVFDKKCIIMVSPITEPLSPTYLEYSWHKVQEANGTVTFVSKPTGRTPSKLETSYLSLYFYQDVPGEVRGIELFSKKIPFIKNWTP